MADTKISAATSTTPAATDLIPLERPSSAVARYATIAEIVQAQAASTGEKGAVELATTAEAQAGSSAALAITPAGLAAYFQQAVTFGVNASTAGTIKLSTGQSGYYANIHTFDGTFDGFTDPVLYWGFNIAANGARVDAARHQLVQQFEYDYYVGGKHYSEYSLNTIDTAGTGVRWVGFNMNRADSSEAYWEFRIGDSTTGSSFFVITDKADTVNYLAIIPTRMDITLPMYVPAIIGTGNWVTTGSVMSSTSKIGGVSLDIGGGTPPALTTAYLYRPDGAALLILNTGVAAAAQVIFANQGVDKWTLERLADNTFALGRSGVAYDLVMDTSGGLKICQNVGFYNTAPQAKPTISGAKGSNAALGSLLTALATLGLVTDSTSA